MSSSGGNRGESAHASMSHEMWDALVCATDADGRLTFAEYMETALYSPGGYYQRRVKLGGQGADFYTAAQFPLFGMTLGRYIHELYTKQEQTGPLRIFELGPGQGELACHMCSYLLSHLGDSNSIEYTFVERSAHLQKVQADAVRSLSDRVSFRWLDSEVPQAQVPHAFVVANELLDALPVERVRREQTGYSRGYVLLGQDPQDPQVLTEDFLPAPPDLVRLAEMYVPVPVSHVGEICPGYADVFRMCSLVAQEIDGVFFDYGTYAREWQEGIRPNGTVRAFHQHEVVSVLSNPGEADITADVNWDLARHTAGEAGFRVENIMSQGSFLMRNGITELAAAISSDPSRNDSNEDAMTRQRKVAAVSGALKQLVLPGGMGERFSAFVFSKHKGGA